MVTQFLEKGRNENLRNSLEKMQVIGFTKLLRGLVIEIQSKHYNTDPT